MGKIKLTQLQKEVFEHVKELMQRNDLPKEVLIRAKHLIASGGIDLSNFNKGDYLKSKPILAVAFRQIADDLIPVSSEAKKDYNNLLKF